MALYGGIVGFGTSGLLLLYAVLLYTQLIPWFLPGVLAGTALLAGLGLLRNRLLRFVAARGFRATFRFRTVSFLSYVGAIASGALGIGYGYGPPRSSTLVLPFAALFILLLYLYVLWSRTLVAREEGRLCIFQFLTEHSDDGHGYSWLKRGMSFVESVLQRLGVSTKKDDLYFGSSYSLLEGSYLEWDLDNIYMLGDWTSQPHELKPVHEAVSWFLYRSRTAGEQGFSHAKSILDRISGISPQSLYYIIGATGAIAGLILAFLRR